MPAGSFNWLSMILIIVVFYFFMIMPERKRQKSMKAMIDNVKAGDKIITRGGIYGVIISVTEEAIVIATGPDSTKLELSKLSISSVVETAKTADLEDVVEAEEVEETEEEKTE